jgi:mannose-6-phosphate isomerase
MQDLYPLLFEPALKDYVWGGRNLETLFGRQLPPRKIAESWEIAAHPNGMSFVVNGVHAGLSLGSLYEVLREKLVGSASEWAQQRGKFPLLVKLLDAQSRLSVQVHPDDEYAIKNESGELGKTEMWVVLHAEPDASIIVGVRRGTTRDDFRRAALDGNLEQHLNIVPVSAGDFVCVPSGSVHAILGGLVLAEIQQNSDVTYRVYDWNRNSPDRPLHIDKAMDVINFDQVEAQINFARGLESISGEEREQLCSNQYFTVERWRAPEGYVLDGACDGSTYEIWGVLDGQAKIMGGSDQVEISKVGFALLPAALGSYRLKVLNDATLLKVYTK